MFQFSESLKKVKNLIVEWAKEKFNSSQQDILSIENHISHLYD
jgi:hypothetical protein